MNFGTEFKNMKAKGGAPKLEQATEQVEAAPAETTEEVTEVADYPEGLKHGQTLGDVAAETEGDEPPVIPAPKEEPAPKKIKINGKTFDSVEEAADYAAKLEIELEKKEAVEKALEAAKPKAETPKVDKATKKIAEKFFEDPEAAFDEFDALVTQRAKALIQEADDQKERAAKAKTEAENAWQSFYKNNSDLTDWQDEVNLVTQRNWEILKDLPAEKGMQEIAKLTRQYVNSVKEKALPKQVLSSKPAVTSASGQQLATATKKPTTEKKISFIDQVRSTNKRTAIQSES